jgi:hypothetical protein
MMQDLSEEGRRVIEALVRAPLAWQSPLELARAMGRDLEETTNLLASLDADGWLAAWEREFDVVVTLSVAGASLLGLRLVEAGFDEVPRWAGRGDREPPGLRASGVFRDERAATLELVADPSCTAEDAVERAEEALLRAGSRKQLADHNSCYLPVPTLLVGLGLTPWPGPGDGRKASCPSCASKRLKPSMYCLYCDRWGLDHLLRDDHSTKLRPTIEPKEEARRREFERQIRKTRRRTRLLAQAEAERTAKSRRRLA